MKGWGQIFHNTAKDLMAEVARLAPDSPVLARAVQTFELGDELGIKPSGRPATGYTQTRRQRSIARIEARDKSDQEIAALYLSGLPALAVAKAAHKSIGTVFDALVRTGTPTRPRGSQKGQDAARVERIRLARAKGRTLGDIATVEHISRERVRQICVRNEIPTEQNRDLTADQLAAVKEYLDGDSLNEVGYRHGVGNNSVKNWLYRAGHSPRPTKRTPSDVAAARAERACQLYREGKKGREIAADLGLSRPEMVYRYLAMGGIHPDRQRRRK